MNTLHIDTLSIPTDNQKSTIHKALENTAIHCIPKWFVYAVLGLCLFPVIANLLGVDFATKAYSHSASHVHSHASFVEYAKDLGHYQDGKLAATGTLVDHMFYGLRGAFWHVILEWSAIAIAFLTALLAFAHYRVQRNFVVPFIGVAMLCAGIMDAYHTVAASRIVEATAPNNQLIPFTWAEARLFNAISLLMGAILLLTTRLKREHHIPVLVGSAILLITASTVIIGITSSSDSLPQSMFKDALFARPYDVVPMVLYIILGAVLFPLYNRKTPSVFGTALILSMVPQVLAQMYMAFDSSVLFDNGFNVGHSLKILAYCVPCAGVVIDYVAIANRSKMMTQNLDAMHNEIREQVNESVKGLCGVANKVSERAQSVAQASEELGLLVSKQTDFTAQTAAAMEQMTVSVKDISENAQHVAEETHKANETAQHSSDTVNQSISTMNNIAQSVETAACHIESLNERSQEIGQVISVIDGIAEQTNLLALNAAIEAARAGEHGRGFSVVADEVRNLAAKTQGATNSVSETIGNSQQETESSVGSMRNSMGIVKDGVEQAERAKQGMDEMLATVTQVNLMIANIATANEQQNAVAHDIAQQLNSVNDISLDLSANIQTIMTSAKDLSSLAESTFELADSLDVCQQSPVEENNRV